MVCLPGERRAALLAAFTDTSDMRVGADSNGIAVELDDLRQSQADLHGEVANARVHATTGEIPAVRLEKERCALQPVPAPYAGRIIRRQDRRAPVVPRPLVGMLIGAGL